MDASTKPSQVDEEVGDTTSIAMDTPIVTSPSTDNATPRCCLGRKCKCWERASPLEKFLMLCVFILLLLIIVLSVVLHSHKGVKKRRHANATEYCVTPACVTAAAAILNTMDQSADPCTDFYQYACGGWMRSNSFKEGETSLDILRKLKTFNENIIKRGLEKNNSANVKSEAERQARIFYRSCLDENKTVEKLGAKPMLNLLNKIGGWNISGHFNISEWSFQQALEAIHTHIPVGLFQWEVNSPPIVPRNVLILAQGGLIMQDPRFYLNKTKDDGNIMNYLTLMTQVGILLGGEENSTRTQMQDVIDFEIKLAEISIPKMQLEDVKRIQFKTVKELNEQASVIDWSHFFNTMFKQTNREIPPTQEISIYGYKFFPEMSELVKHYISTQNGRIVIANYLSWSLVSKLLPILSKQFQKVYRTMNGLKDTKRSVFCLQQMIGAPQEPGLMEFVLDAIFIREKFQRDGRDRVEEDIIQIKGMINMIRDAFKKNLPFLKWIDQDTRNLVIEKADAMLLQVGYPEFILNSKKLDEFYNGIEFNATDYFQNQIAYLQFFRKQLISKLDKPFDRNEWAIPIYNTNAFHIHPANRMEILAGIILAPFYDSSYPMYLNFGSLGFVLGHEFTHAFDSNGINFDKLGVFRPWLNNSFSEVFNKKTQCFIHQYSSYEVNGTHLNGVFTLGEDIADNGGLNAALNAYRKWIAEHPKELALPAVPMTNIQIFFISFAQTWCSINTPEDMVKRILTDSHTLNKYRVIGTLSNSPDFSREFKCSNKSAMNPEKKCILW